MEPLTEPLSPQPEVVQGPCTTWHGTWAPQTQGM